MKIQANKDKSLMFMPETARDCNFLSYLMELCEARDEKIKSLLGSASLASTSAIHAQETEIVDASP